MSERFWRIENVLLLPKLESQAAQRLTSRCTDYSIPAAISFHASLQRDLNDLNFVLPCLMLITTFIKQRLRTTLFILNYVLVIAPTCFDFY